MKAFGSVIQPVGWRWDGIHWIDLPQNRNQWREYGNEPSGSIGSRGSSGAAAQQAASQAGFSPTELVYEKN
jgi:hypothetical protein